MAATVTDRPTPEAHGHHVPVLATAVVDALGEYSPWTLFGYAALVSAAVIAVRFVWVFAVLQAPKWIARRMSSWRGAHIHRVVFGALSASALQRFLQLSEVLETKLATGSHSRFRPRAVISLRQRIGAQVKQVA